jgi:hypothetical protein
MVFQCKIDGSIKLLFYLLHDSGNSFNNLPFALFLRKQAQIKSDIPVRILSDWGTSDQLQVLHKNFNQEEIMKAQRENRGIALRFL